MDDFSRAVLDLEIASDKNVRAAHRRQCQDTPCSPVQMAKRVGETIAVPLFCSLFNSDFGFRSDFGIRISDFRAASFAFIPTCRL
jgi:hypothetical protein